eukprot:TRINITY_DN15301_c0_g1_i3.p1 TRINITY_DN15301_c0_g1~~TRINITY_DN15301_c0_g1_i3.p1  ORF type:complete len:354 (+),score=66.87 TRINITY_DN15301_c0_g1_i3:245-1306(+)
MRALTAAWDEGMRFYDTAPFYGRGQAEHRVGRFLYDIPRSEYFLQTKVGRVLLRPSQRRRPPPHHGGLSATTWAEERAALAVPDGAHGAMEFEIVHDYTYSGIMRSFEESLQRLGVPRVDSLVIHDLDSMFFDSPDLIRHHMQQLEQSGSKALRELKDTGEVSAVGAGVNDCGTITRYLESSVDVDFFVVAQVYSLLHNTGRVSSWCSEEVVRQGGSLHELNRCLREGVGVVAASPFNAGILVHGPRCDGTDICNYRPATDEEVKRAAALAAICREHGVPLGAAALQFPLGHPAVTSVVFGIGSEEEARVGMGWASYPIPANLWRAMRERELVRPEVPLPCDQLPAAAPAAAD